LKCLNCEATGVKPIEKLYTQFSPAIFRRARQVLRKDADAWDVVQEVFVQLLKNPNSFRGEARPMTFIYRITTNLALNAVRSRKLKEGHLHLVNEEAQDANAESRQLVEKWISILSEREVEVATLLYIDGLSQQEVADVLLMSRKTIGRDVDEMRKKLEALGALPKELS
jgi:RNA polymerase sigma-70 factor, ECF subfamily